MFKYWLKRHLKRLVRERHNQRAQVWISLHAIKRAVVLVDAAQLAEVAPFRSELERLGVQLHIWAISPIVKEGEECIDPAVRLLTPAELWCCNQRVKREVIAEFDQLEPDAIFSLLGSYSYPIAALLAHSFAPLKVGYEVGSEMPLDLTICSKKAFSVAEIGENMLFYLRRIDIKDNN